MYFCVESECKLLSFDWTRGRQDGIRYGAGTRFQGHGKTTGPHANNDKCRSLCESDVDCWGTTFEMFRRDCMFYGPRHKNSLSDRPLQLGVKSCYREPTPRGKSILKYFVMLN